MKGRMRSPCRSASQSMIEERIQRFLRPGALARLRDTRISSRAAPRSAFAVLSRRYPQGGRLLHLSPPSSPAPAHGVAAASPAQVPVVNGFPCFLTGHRGPRFPQKKKLLAAKAMFLVPGSPVAPDPASSPVVEVFDGDLLLAH